VYEYICLHFFACCAMDAKGAETKVTIDIAGELFLAKGLMIHERNYLDIYRYESWNASTIPSYRQGERFTPTAMVMTEGATSAPELLAEADLIKKMDDHGIGTDATIAEHIKTIQERQYVLMNAQRFFEPCPLGKALYDGYQNADINAMMAPQMRAALEADCKLVCEGRKTKEQVGVRIVYGSNYCVYARTN
jgi:DNA topoisomerase-3